MKTRNFFYLLMFVCCLFTSCQAPKLGYFQDVQAGQSQTLQDPKLVTIQPGDKLSILVGSKDPGLAYLFNLQIVGRYKTSQSDANLSTSQVASYTLDENGDIDFPVLGKLNIKGKTRSEVAAFIKNELIRRDLLKDPIVTVDFLDLYFSVMGEVKTPGRFLMDHDKTTLIDALSRAGDLTINGRRDNVLVIRETDGKQLAYRIDLTNLQSIYNSPVYYLKQGDMIYIEPNEKKARESTATGNAFLQPSLWISLASLLTSISVLIFK
ncbi:MAG: polysaccharide export protein [Muribaculaceae bacterium]|nr:polysaccharide export protein [Muribaculaceae bacterium]